MFDVWTGDVVEPTVVSFTTSDADCAVSASADRDWLMVEVDTSANEPSLRIQVVEDALVSGADVGVVTLQGPDGAPVASIDVDLRALTPGSAGASRHVVVIGIDGLRPDALQSADAPHLASLFARGRSTYEASTQLTTLTKSGPGWASILTGVEATKHLVDSNDDLAEMDFTYATMVQRVESAGLDAKVVTNWFGIAVLTEDGLDKQTFPGNDVAVGDAAVGHLSGDAPVLLFLQFDQVDVAGHLHGFSPDIPQYVTAIENVDDLVGEIVDAVIERPSIAQEDWLFVVVTDHSGQDKDHGPMDTIHRTIPLAFAGPTVPHEALPARGGAEPAPSHMDVAPSAYAFLGITTSDEWGLDGVARVAAP